LKSYISDSFTRSDINPRHISTDGKGPDPVGLKECKQTKKLKDIEGTLIRLS